MHKELAVWFPAVEADTGTDIYTLRLIQGLNERGIRAEASWLPLRAEYSPWTVRRPQPPEWATIAHINTWLPTRFIPRNLPFVATIHHSVHDPDASPFKGLLRSLYHKHWIAPVERQALLRAQKVIAVSQFVAQSTQKTLADIPIEVIYNGVDTQIFNRSSHERNPESPFRLLYVGSWIRRKGVDLLAPIMRDLGNNFELLYTGGPASERDKAAMPANMYDIGRLQGDHNVASAMRNADALLFPSRSEGFGLVPAEAMACGLPVIATDCSSLAEIINDGTTGLLCPPDDVSAFANAARRLSSKGLDGKNLRDHVKANFSMEKSIDSTIAVYRSVMKSRTMH